MSTAGTIIAERGNAAVAAAAASSPWWMPTLTKLSETMEIWLPIVGMAWLLLQIGAWLWPKLKGWLNAR